MNTSRIKPSTQMESLEDIDMIKNQTGIDDERIIKDALVDHKNDIIATIMYLSELEACKERYPEKKRSEQDKHMDYVREVVNDKEAIFFKVFEDMRDNRREAPSETNCDITAEA
jgi:hypothetical protein